MDGKKGRKKEGQWLTKPGMPEKAGRSAKSGNVTRAADAYGATEH